MYFDSHCHLDLEPLCQQQEGVLGRAWEAKVSHMVVPAVSASTWDQVFKSCLADHAIRRYPALGLHPCFLDRHQDQLDLDKLAAQLAQNPSVCAVGECGLDFYIENPEKTRQVALFEAQVELAKQCELPVIIHSRRSLDQVIQLLRRLKPQEGGVVHAFSGSAQQASQLWDLGFRIGVGGSVTYERAQKLRRVVATHPAEAMLLETDAPDMPLSGFQGQANEPARVARVAEVVAQIRGEPLEQIASQTSQNAQSLFVRSL